MRATCSPVRSRVGILVSMLLAPGPLVLAAALLHPLPALAATIVVTRSAGEETLPATKAVASLWRESESDASCLGHWGADDKGRVTLPDAALRGADLLVVTSPDACRKEIPLPAAPGTIRVLLPQGLSRPLVVLDHGGRPVPRIRWVALPWSRFGDPLELARTQALQGTLVDGPGLYRLPAGRLALVAEGIETHEATTEKGLVVMRHLEDGEHLLLVGVEGYGVQAVRFDPADETPVAIRLPDPASCEPVRVVDRETGQPLAGVIAAPFPSFATGPWRSLWPMVPSGPDGLLPTRCPAFVRWVGNATELLVAEDHAPYFPAEGDHRADPWVMDGGVTLEGVAIDEDGEPLVGTVVEASVRGVVVHGEVDANGRFAVPGVPRGTVHVRLLDEEGRVLVSRDVDTGEDRTVNLDLSPGRALVFRLLRNGDPWTDTRVVLLEPGHEDDVRILGVAQPGPEGLVRLPFVFSSGSEDDDEPPNELFVAILDGNQVVTVPFPRKGLLARLVSLVSDDDEPRTLDVRGRVVEGRIVDADTGEPIPGAMLSGYRYGHCIPTAVDRSSPLYVDSLGGYFEACRGLFARAGADDRGRVEIFLPEGIRTVLAEGPPGWSAGSGTPWTRDSKSVGDLSPEEPTEFRLRRSASVTVTVVTPDGALPAGCMVGWRHVADGPAAGGRKVSCRPRGTTIHPPADTPVIITAEAPGHARVIEGPLTIARGTREQVTLALGKPGTIRLELAETPTIGGRPWVPPGTLRDAAGRDMLSLARVTGSRDLRTIVFSDLPAGRYIVEILGERKKVDLEEGDEITIRIGF